MGQENFGVSVFASHIIPATTSTVDTLPDASRPVATSTVEISPEASHPAALQLHVVGGPGSVSVKLT